MMEEKQTRRVFTREFKVEAVELLISGNKKAVEVAGAATPLVPAPVEIHLIIFNNSICACRSFTMTLFHRMPDASLCAY